MPSRNYNLTELEISKFRLELEALKKTLADLDKKIAKVCHSCGQALPVSSGNKSAPA